MTKPSFSLNEFKKWLTGQEDLPGSVRKPISNTTEPHHVESRLGIGRLKEQIAKHNPNLENSGLAETFKSRGGLMVESDGLHATIEIGDKRFVLPVTYIKLSDDC